MTPPCSLLSGRRTWTWIPGWPRSLRTTPHSSRRWPMISISVDASVVRISGYWVAQQVCTRFAPHYLFCCRIVLDICLLFLNDLICLLLFSFRIHCQVLLLSPLYLFSFPFPSLCRFCPCPSSASR